MQRQIIKDEKSKTDLSNRQQIVAHLGFRYREKRMVDGENDCRVWPAFLILGF